VESLAGRSLEGTAVGLQDVECDVIVIGGGLEVRAHVVAGHGDCAAEGLSAGERLGHGG